MGVFIVPNAYYWRCLFTSIILEVIGTSVMKLSQDSWPVFGMGVMYILLALSYFCLAKSIIRLPVGVAYAFWEGIGLVCIALMSVLLLGEHPGGARIAALGLILVGTLFVHHGTDSGEEVASAHHGGV